MYVLDWARETCLSAGFGADFKGRFELSSLGGGENGAGAFRPASPVTRSSTTQLVITQLVAHPWAEKNILYNAQISDKMPYTVARLETICDGFTVHHVFSNYIFKKEFFRI